MAGILNSKERMIDFIITEEGRRQATAGQMKFQFATLTDTHTFYAASGSKQPDIAEDASDRIYFETTQKYQDVIVPELTPGNSMRPFRVKDFIIDGLTVASGTFGVGYSTQLINLTGSRLANHVGRAIDAIGQNFENLRILATIDPFAETTGFEVNNHTGSFHVWTDMPTDKSPDGHVNLDLTPSLFSDRRFSHFPNFKFMPPKNVDRPGVPGALLGNYPQLNEPPRDRWEDFEANIGTQYEDFTFPQTSRENNLVGQFFEVNTKGIEKLSIIDYGEFELEDPLAPPKQVFFVGKLLRDSVGAETFMNIFTVVLE
jgi:hypothetical protein